MEGVACRREVRGAWCQMCGPGRTNCFTLCHVQDGVWTHVEGCPNAANNGVFGGKTLCAKGNAAPRSLDSSARLLHPMHRIGPKGPGARFERIGWDEALDSIAEVLLRQKDSYGPETFGILSPQFYPVTAGLGRRLLNVHGSPNYLHSAICHVQRDVSTATVLGQGRGGPMATSTSPAQLDKTELLVSWGANPENAAVNLGPLRRRLDAAGRGMKVVDIRPLCDPLASKADIWLPVRPGTDLSLALGFLNVICGEGLYDRRFVDSWCHGFKELCEHVRPYTPQWAQERCGIPASQIREVAHMIAAAKPCGIIYGNGVGDQSRDGHWTVAAIELIGAICSNVGRPGGGADGLAIPPLVRFSPMPPTLADRLPASAEDIEHGWRAGTSKLVAPEFPRWHEGASRREPTSSYLRGLMSVLTGKPYPLRAVLAQATNPLSATRQPKLVAQALERLEFFFVMDMFRNPSCDYADIVLPAASAYECSQLVGMRNFNEGTFLAVGQKVADPPGEAMSDAEFYLRLACRLGYGADFWGGDIEAYLEDLVRPTGYSVSQLRDAPTGVFVPRPSRSGLPGDRCDETGTASGHAGSAARDRAGSASRPQDDEPDYAALFSGLPYGKVQCLNEVVGGKTGVDGQTVLPALPEYRGPAEGIAETPELARDYPYAFSDVHADRLANHSYYGDVAQLRRFEPEPWVRMHPATAAAHGIVDGDWVDVESPHGTCVLKARLTKGIAPDVLMARRGWWQPCPELGVCGYGWEDRGAEVNVLYSGDAEHSDPFHSAHGKQTLVRIRRHEGGGPAVYTICEKPGDGAAPADDERVWMPPSARSISFDATRCTACHSCEVACARWHGIEGPAAGHIRITCDEAGEFPEVTMRFSVEVAQTCDGCAEYGGEPRCVTTCPCRALSHT